MRNTLLTLALALTVGHAAHAFQIITPQVDTSALPSTAKTWDEPNPLRGNKDAIAIGRSAFNQSCAQCHGTDANGSRSPRSPRTAPTPGGASLPHPPPPPPSPEDPPTVPLP